MLTPEQLAVNAANNKLQAVVMEAELSRSPSMSPADVTQLEWNLAYICDTHVSFTLSPLEVVLLTERI